MKAFVERLRRTGDVTAPSGHFQTILFVPAILAFLLVKFDLLSLININWDEFLFLSRVHEFHRGELTSAFQTFHVHFFQWLVAVPGNEIDQVIAARAVAYGLRIASTILVFLLGLRVAGRTGGLVAALASLVFSHVLRHGESFRADPLIAFLFLLTAALLVWRFHSIVAVVVAALGFALAASVTIKAAIYVPALAGIVTLMIWSEGVDSRRQRVRRTMLFAVTSAAAYLAFSLMHAAATSAPDAEVATRAAASGAGMMWNAQFDILARTLRTDWAFWVLFSIGVAFALYRMSRGPNETRARSALLLALLLPLASLALYRNTFEYFYVTLIPLASLACGYAVAHLEALVPNALRSAVPVLLVAPMVFQGGRFATALRFDGIEPQRDVLTAVHEMFPDPVPYLDRCGMVSSFPRARVFMSTYVLARYRERGVPSMAGIVAEDQPHFLLTNVSGLALEQSWDTVRTYQRRLLREDFEFLQNNFVQHWGPIWLPGKRLAPSGREIPFAIVVGGPYTVESQQPVTIDGVLARPADVVQLQRGTHRVAGRDTLTLRFGARLPRPAHDPPFKRLFRPL